MREKNALYIRGKWIDCKVATPCFKKGEEGEGKVSEEVKSFPNAFAE